MSLPFSLTPRSDEGGVAGDSWQAVGWVFSSPRKEAMEREGPLNNGPEAPVAPAAPVLASAELRSPSHPGWHERYSSEPCETGNTYRHGPAHLSRVF